MTQAVVSKKDSVQLPQGLGTSVTPSVTLLKKIDYLTSYWQRKSSNLKSEKQRNLCPMDLLKIIENYASYVCKFDIYNKEYATLTIIKQRFNDILNICLKSSGEIIIVNSSPIKNNNFVNIKFVTNWTYKLGYYFGFVSKFGTINSHSLFDKKMFGNVCQYSMPYLISKVETSMRRNFNVKNSYSYELSGYATIKTFDIKPMKNDIIKMGIENNKYFKWFLNNKLLYKLDLIKNNLLNQNMYFNIHLCSAILGELNTSFQIT